MKELINNFKTLFTKSEQKSIGILFLGILVRGVVEIVGIATILPFMAVVSGPEIIHNNEYLLAIYTYFDFQNKNFAEKKTANCRIFLAESGKMF